MVWSEKRIWPTLSSRKDGIKTVGEVVIDSGKDI